MLLILRNDNSDNHDTDNDNMYNNDTDNVNGNTTINKYNRDDGSHNRRTTPGTSGTCPSALARWRGNKYVYDIPISLSLSLYIYIYITTYVPYNYMFIIISSNIMNSINMLMVIIVIIIIITIRLCSGGATCRRLLTCPTQAFCNSGESCSKLW